MVVLIFDLDTHEQFRILNERIRVSESDVHAVWNNLHDLPTGDYESVIDRVWYIGQVLSKLTDMVSGKVIDTEAVLVYNKKNYLLDQAIQELLPDNTSKDLTEYDSLYR
jgi:hypothetical protein